MSKEKTDVQKLMAKKKKEPINKLLSYFILSKLNEGCSKYKTFIGKTHKDIVSEIYGTYRDDEDFKKFMVGWISTDVELKYLIRIELYKHIDEENVKEDKSHGKWISYRLTKKGQKYLQTTLSKWFLVDSGRCEVVEMVYAN